MFCRGGPGWGGVALGVITRFVIASSRLLVIQPCNFVWVYFSSTRLARSRSLQQKTRNFEQFTKLFLVTLRMRACFVEMDLDCRVFQLWILARENSRFEIWTRVERYANAEFKRLDKARRDAARSDGARLSRCLLITPPRQTCLLNKQDRTFQSVLFYYVQIKLQFTTIAFGDNF